ncbi:chaperonin CPN60-like 2, mitochondrial isoform X1 [Papaver somniferum]|uniref:chaperonin CPN60-like 2, mitochondrial isoform X1 n=2 Tax=Papaver somniferum TaxID=3469 RepID=UPI000E6FC05E|nr:chaperonin CPN60-like 2, mitochondrial isoform X1 [Papaver somniferum]XP_026427787.1 chaperonin CPN60-like 2, mitochondrial isoform X1 [Papaver somniferum]
MLPFVYTSQYICGCADVHLQLITEDQGLKLDKVHIGMLGTAKNVTVSVDDTIILHGGGNKKLIEERCEQLKTSLENNSVMFDKEKAQERLSKLSGGVAVFKVGGARETKVGERKDRVTDALNATKVAVEEGILPGGGVALLYSSRVLDNLQTANNDQKRGVEIIQNALKAPTFTISRISRSAGTFKWNCTYYSTNASGLSFALLLM